MEINLGIFSQRTMRIFQSALRFVTHMEHGFSEANICCGRWPRTGARQEER